MELPASSSDALSLPLALALIDRSVTIRGSPKRPPPPPPLSDRAQQRLIRQAIIQAECEAEEREALRITAEELRILHDSVKSVKAEFSDLDGLSWDTPAAQQFLQQWHADQAARDRASSSASPPLLARSPLRRINAPSALSFPATAGVSIAISPATASSLGSGIPDTSFEDTIRLPRCADSRRSSTASTIVPERDGARTPLPALFASLEDVPAKSPAGAQDKENDVPSAEVCPRLPKSHSAPEISLSRPTKSLPPSLIPILRSKSLSARPSRAAPGSGKGKDLDARRASSLTLRRTDQRPSQDTLGLPGCATGSTCVTAKTNVDINKNAPLSPAKRSLAAAGLSASIRRVPEEHPGAVLALANLGGGGNGSMNTNMNGRVPSGSPVGSKFRIVSAPVAAQRPHPTPVSSSRVGAGTRERGRACHPTPGLQLVRGPIVMVGSGSSSNSSAQRKTKMRIASASLGSPTRPSTTTATEGAVSPSRVSKRLRDGESNSEDSDPGRKYPVLRTLAELVPVRPRAGSMSTGGVPMRRT